MVWKEEWSVQTISFSEAVTHAAVIFITFVSSSCAMVLIHLKGPRRHKSHVGLQSALGYSGLDSLPASQV